MRLFPGLLISCARMEEHNASAEISRILRSEFDFEFSDLKIRQTGVEGLITVGLPEIEDYHKIVKQLQDLEESSFQECLKIRPIDNVVDTLDEVINYIENQFDDIPFSGSYMIEVEKRFTPISSEEVITPIAEILDQNYEVDLENPSWMVLVEILEDKFGVSILEPELIFTTPIAYDEYGE